MLLMMMMMMRGIDEGSNAAFIDIKHLKINGPSNHDSLKVHHQLELAMSTIMLWRTRIYIDPSYPEQWTRPDDSFGGPCCVVGFTQKLSPYRSQHGCRHWSSISSSSLGCIASQQLSILDNKDEASGCITRFLNDDEPWALCCIASPPVPLYIPVKRAAEAQPFKRLWNCLGAVLSTARTNPRFGRVYPPLLLTCPYLSVCAQTSSLSFQTHLSGTT